MKFENKQPIILRVDLQGAPVVNDAHVFKGGDEVVLVYVDLKSKYCTIGMGCYGTDRSPGLYINSDENCTNLNKGEGVESFTKITFPEFIGWDIFADAISKYTISICFVKNKQQC